MVNINFHIGIGAIVEVVGFPQVVGKKATAPCFPLACTVLPPPRWYAYLDPVGCRPCAPDRWQLPRAPWFGDNNVGICGPRARLQEESPENGKQRQYLSNVLSMSNRKILSCTCIADECNKPLLFLELLPWCEIKELTPGMAAVEAQLSYGNHNGTYRMHEYTSKKQIRNPDPASRLSNIQKANHQLQTPPGRCRSQTAQNHAKPHLTMSYGALVIGQIAVLQVFERFSYSMVPMFLG